jgi:hypothetical protein
MATPSLEYLEALTTNYVYVPASHSRCWCARTPEPSLTQLFPGESGPRDQLPPVLCDRTDQLRLSQLRVRQGVLACREQSGLDDR